MAKKDIYLSDDLWQRAKDAGIRYSPLCQPIIGYAVLHGQEAAEAALRNLGTAAAEQLDPTQLDRIEKMVTDLHGPEHKQLRQRQDDRADWTTADWIRADWSKLATAVVLVGLVNHYAPA